MLNSWSNISVSSSIWSEIRGHGFKSHSGQLFIASSRNLSVVNTIYIGSFRYAHVITYGKIWLNKGGEWRVQRAETKCDTKQTMKLEKLCNVSSECELNWWSDSSIGYSVWTENSGCGFKSHSGHFSIATSNNLSVVNTICIISSCTHVITYRKVQLNKRGDWQRQTAEMKCDTKQTMKLK